MILNSIRSAAPNACRAGLLVAAVTTSLFAVTATASAATGFVDSFSIQRDGPQAYTAGGHPDVTTSMRFVVDPTGGASGDPSPLESAKTVDVDLPPGLVGNVAGVPTCPEYRLLPFDCPPEAQIGMATLTSSSGAQSVAPLYNATPAGGATAQFGFSVLGIVVTRITASVLPGDDYRLRMTLVDLPSQYLDITQLDVTVWGVPADRSHDSQRIPRGLPFPVPGGLASGADRVPLLTNPVECTGEPAVTTATVDSWQHPGSFLTVQSSEPPLTGCEGLRFDPSMTVSPTTTQAGAPTGLDVGMSFPQDENPDGIGTSRLRRASVQLPEGMVISPSAASGLEACTDAQLGAGSSTPERCPSASKVGTVSIDSPLLDDDLTGDLYVGAPLPGNMYRLFLTAFGTGVRVKLEGRITPDPVTGRLTATFEDTPQLPVNRIDLHLFGGPQAVLSNPRTCGPATTTASLRGYGVPTDAVVSSTFAVTGCALPRFTPTFTAGMTNPLAGSLSPFTTTITRTDADQDLSGISMQLPPGLLGNISSVPLCPTSQADAGTCGAASRIGSTTVSAGPGSVPYVLHGPVFLSGPLRGAPFSLSVVVRAVAGPYDLGTVVVRAPITVDAKTARASVVTDALPRILSGVPVQLRRIAVDLDRPGFMFNATSCTPSAIGAFFSSTGGIGTATSERYQPQACAVLRMTPSLQFTTSGRNQLGKGRHPAFTARLRQTGRQAGLKTVKVALPLALALDAENAKGLCTPGQFQARTCPESSIIGKASASTPALHEPLTGPVYFVEGTRKTKSGRIIKTLPNLWLKLEGEGVPLDLVATSNVTRSKQLVTTFKALPDAPIADFRLEINGGANGILKTTAGLCARSTPRKSDVQFDGHNGKRLKRRVSVKTTGCGGSGAPTTKSARGARGEATPQRR